MKVAFIGTGSMGGSMSRNLAAAGIDITVFDLNTESMQKPIAAGAKAATSGVDCVTGADVLITMLPTPQAIEGCMISSGVAAAMKPGSMWIDMSTSVPETAKAVGEEVFGDKFVLEGEDELFLSGDNAYRYFRETRKSACNCKRRIYSIKKLTC